MSIYRSTGTLTGHIASENVAEAQAYLQQDDMTQYLDDGLKPAVERIQWYLAGDGHSYYVEAITRFPLSAEQLKELASWVSGQNSDGLGESFEQQEFAWDDGYNEEDARGNAYYEDEQQGCMISFDWEKNDSEFTQV